MKSLSLVLCVLFAASAAMAQTAPQKSFDQMKALSGGWEGKNTQGQPVLVTFRDTAGGSALMRLNGAAGRLPIFSTRERILAMQLLSSASR